MAPRLASVIPASRLAVLDRVGHVAMLEAPEATARAVLGMVETAAACREPRAAVDTPRSVRR